MIENPILNSPFAQPTRHFALDDEGAPTGAIVEGSVTQSVIWPGAVVHLDAPVVPHMGWNVVDAAPGSALFKGLAADTRFYFVHSYAAQRWDGQADALLTWATHHVPFLAAVEDGVLSATQFHPEKSGDAGAALLSNWVEGL